MTTATFVRIYPAWQCVCGRALKAWDVDTTSTAQMPFRILCSGCHAELVAVEREQDQLAHMSQLGDPKAD